MTSHDPDFWEKAGDVCGLYLNPPENAVVWSVDEKSGMQAKSRVNPTKPAVPGIAGPTGVRVPASRHRRALRRSRRPRRRRRRLGHRLDPLGELRRPSWATWSTRPPTGLDLHCIVDNLSAHDTGLVRDFLASQPPRAPALHPTHASWLNQVELFFSILERRLLRRGEFDSVDHLAERVIAFIKDYNRRAAPFRWTYDGRPLMAA